jgi:hypothetical protein
MMIDTDELCRALVRSGNQACSISPNGRVHVFGRWGLLSFDTPAQLKAWVDLELSESGRATAVNQLAKP